MGDGRIVVGIDGSPESKTALRWAFAEARLRGASVHVIHAWQNPAVTLTSYGGTYLPVVEKPSIEKAAKAFVHDTLAALDPSDLEVDHQASTTHGHPAHVLVEASEGADLVVVGSRGHGGFVGMLLGSVSRHVVTHAKCSVVVTRGEPDSA